MNDQEKIKAALATAVKTIYLFDNSNYETDLYRIVGILGGDETAELLANDSKAAMRLCCPEWFDEDE